MELYSPEYYMNEALKQAQMAKEQGEIPIGAVVVCHQRIIARAHNQTQLLHDVTAHAEMLAITAAASYLGSKYLHDCELYVTVEPCPMCAAASRWAQLGQISYGTSDEKSGYMQFGAAMLHPKTKVRYGILEQECKMMMTDFFKEKRKLA